MRIGRLPFQRDASLSQLRVRGRNVAARMLGEGSAITVNGLDAGIRTLAVVTVLVLSVLGYGRVAASPLGFSVDPVIISIALVGYNLLVISVLGVPWRKPPGFSLFVLDWSVVSLAVLLTGGFFSPFLILYYALVIGAALRVGLSRSLFLVAGCAVVYVALSATRPTPVDAIHLPVLAVGITSLLMVAMSSLVLKRAVEVEVRKVELEENTAAQLRLLNNLTRVVLSGSLDLEQVMRTVASVSSQALHADSGLAVLFEAGAPEEIRNQKSEIRNQISHIVPPQVQDPDSASSRPDSYLLPSSFFPLVVSHQEPSPEGLSPGESRIAEQAMHTHAPVLVEDVQTQAEGKLSNQAYPGLAPDGRSVRTLACVPFVLGGEPIGVLFVGRCEQRPFGEAEVSLLTAIGQQMAVAVRLARLYEMERERATRSEERERLERDLLSIVSHELRTPLTSIKTCVGALASVERPEQQATETRLIHNIDRSTERLIVLVNELLDMASLRAGRVSLNLQPLNMGDVLQEIAPQVRPLLDARQQTLEIDLPTAGSQRWHKLAVEADRRRIEQVLLNLLANANKYTPQGGRITLGATPRNDQVRVFVRDDGPGIAPGEQERVFEKYYQGAARENPRDGSGLGLAISRSIVELHTGHIGVQSRLGRGSTFFFTLPGRNCDEERQNSENLDCR